MLKNNLKPQGSQKLNRNELKEVTGGSAGKSACLMACTHFEGGMEVIGCASTDTCVEYDCGNGLIGYYCAYS